MNDKTSLNEGIKVIEFKNCLLCGTKGSVVYEDQRDRLFEAPGVWSIMYCNKCDLAWLNPKPVPDDIPKLYLNYYTHNVEFPNLAMANLLRYINESILSSCFGYDIKHGSKLFGKLLSFVGPIKEIVGRSLMWLDAKERGRLLDVGCGNGQFLAQMKELGWDVIGVEPDREAVKVAREHFGLEVHEGTLESMHFPDESFDVITMNHVIEHVADPIKLLKECHRILKKGGKLIMTTPNVISLGRRIFGIHWVHWDPPRHLFLFSPKSLMVCAEIAGFRVENIKINSDAGYVWVASRLIKRDGRLPGAKIGNANIFLKIEGLIIWMIEYYTNKFWTIGGEIIMEARK